MATLTPPSARREAQLREEEMRVKSSIYRPTALSVILACSLLVIHVRAAVLPTVVRGAKAVVLKPAPGPLTLRILKRDLNIYEGPDDIVAYLFDPHRELIATASLPDDGQEGGGASPEVQSAEMKVDCTLAGTYRLVIDGGGDFVFGLEMSQGQYMVEGNMMLNDGQVSGPVYFRPPKQPFTIKARALHNPGRHRMPLEDGKGNVLDTFDITKTGEWKEFAVSEDAGDRTAPWHFDIGKMDVDIQVPGALYWTCDPEAYFPAEKFRWMLYPYSATRYLQPGESADILYTLRNQTGATGGFALEAGADDRLTCTLVAPESPVNLRHERYKNTQRIKVRVQAAEDAPPGAVIRSHIKAAAAHQPEVIQSAGIRIVVGPSPVARMLDGPIVLTRYEHENYQFGYAPDYIENEVYFDLNNRPYIRHRTAHKYTSTALFLLEDGKWAERPYVPAVQEAYPDYRGFYMGGGSVGAKVAFDGDNGAYTPLLAMRTGKPHQAVVVYTPDAGHTYSVHPFEGAAFDIEQFTGHNALDIPPTVLGYRKTKDHPARFCAYHDLLLHLPKKVDGKLQMGDPVLVSDNCLGSCQHSGGPASTVTRDGKTHVVWGEVAEDDAPGVPTYIATYDHAGAKLGDKVFLDHGPPVNDVHNVPAVTMDSEGYIHVVTGAHGANFKHLRSLRPNDAYGGWTRPVNVLDAGYVDDNTDEDGQGRQTYISLVCDQQDALHIAYRQWRRGVDEYHAGNIYAALSVQSKPKGQPWGPAQPRVIPPVDGYSIYYHKLTVDRLGNLYLSYSYYTADLTYHNEFPQHYHNRAIQLSRDGGKTWKLAETADFAAGVIQ